ncbi:MAG: glycoside hydrolase family 2 [Prevotellaceae bacterium]|jgi:hypothetical protein|nr:glycoside hydrolase family 2 [Prevotellaceae bacterium]
MKSFSIFITNIALLAILLSGCSDRFSAIENGFVSPPDSVRISVYWYWINDNISKEAVVKDLQSMKQVGITRAFIGNIGQQSYPVGNVKILSDEWWDVMHTALKTATELGIEIGIFNSPGWSQSGGPWIKPEQSMRYLAASELRVKGPVKLEQKLSISGTSDFQDLKVIAFPVSGDYGQNLFDTPAARTTFSSNKILWVRASNTPEKYIIPQGESYIGLSLPRACTARSLELKVFDYAYAEAELQAKDGAGFRTVKQFVINRTNASLNVGFAPYAPIVVTFPEVTSSEYRIVFRNTEGVRFSDIILSATPTMERYPEKSLAKMFQSPLPYWHDYLWDKQPAIQSGAVASIAKPSQVQDISKNMSADGTLSWDVPEGEWIIMRMGMRSTGVTNSPASLEGTGLEVDKMSKKHVAAHFDAFLGKIIERVPAKDRKTWKLAVQDSYETGGQNFTDGFLEEFKERYGYDALPYLPVFNGHVIGNPDLSDRFLWDVRRMVADKIAYDYVGGLREICHKHGLGTWLENYGHWGFPGEFLQYGGQSDEVGGEFWSEGELGDIENRAASSCAHIYGKTRVSAESFTCGGNAYARYPAVMKRRGDWSFTEGINNTLLHVYIQQAYEDRYPGIDEWFGNEFNRKNTWFKHIDLFTLYLKRCNFMLQQGLNVADVAYFIGEDAPKMTGVRNPEIPKGYSFDYINGEVIMRDLSVKDGKLTLPHGTSYSVLVLPKLETMRPEVLQKIEQLVSEGAIILGPPPSRSPSMKGYPEADEQVNSLAKKMWGDLSVKQRSYGKGTILTDMSMQEVFDLLKIVPDCGIDNKMPLLYNHRTLDGKDIYFITNQSEQRVKTSIAFRVKGMQPELWDAVTGNIRPLPAFEQTGEITTVPLQLESLESIFIVFRKESSSISSPAQHNANFPEPETVAEINSSWEVTFESDAVKRGIAGTVIFDKLTDWSKHENEQIRYYSGTAVYKTKFALAEKPAGKKLYLDLGKVNVMAKVKVNGQCVGGVWTTPYRVDVTSQLKTGDNSVEIEVVNTWVNRIIGDLQLPPESRIVKTDKLTNVNAPLQQSGLLGPVLIVKN